MVNDMSLQFIVLLKVFLFINSLAEPSDSLVLKTSKGQIVINNGDTNIELDFIGINSSNHNPMLYDFKGRIHVEALAKVI
jgi:hypothetical protein